MKKKHIYLALSIIGFAVPNYFVFFETIENGNIMLYGNLPATLEGMFANRISTTFIVDLLIAVMVFFVWSFHEAKKFEIKGIGWIWLVTMVFGLSVTFPLFLYFREGKKSVTLE